MVFLRHRPPSPPSITLTAGYRCIAVIMVMMVLGAPLTTAVGQTRGGTEVHAGFGAAYAVSETPSSDRVPAPLLRLSLLHAFTSHISLELGAGYTVFSSMNRERYADIATTSLPVDLRLRFALRSAHSRMRPFLFVGMGHQSFSYDIPTLRRTGWSEVLRDDPDAVRSGRLADSSGSSSWFVPLGGGLRFALSERSALELSVAACPTFNDDLNPLHDGSNDGWLHAALAFSYALGYSPEPVIAEDHADGVAAPMTTSHAHTPEHAGERRYGDRGNSDRGSADRGREERTDSDADGLSDDEEQKTRTNARIADTDQDGLSDGDEVLRYRTDPLRVDSDGDGLSDAEEVMFYHTDPLERDSDHGSMSDGIEVLTMHSNPNDPSDDVPRRVRSMGAPEANDVVSGSLERDTTDETSTPEMDDDSSRPSATDMEPEISTADTIGSSYDELYETDTLSQNDVRTTEIPDENRDERAADQAVQPPAKHGGELAGTESKGRRFVFSDITFADSRSELLPSSRSALDSAFRLLATYKDMKVEIQGYASKSRKADRREDLARELSRKRAQSVVDYLVYRGISKKRLSAKGYGTERPLVEEDPYDTRNRRIEFLVK